MSTKEEIITKKYGKASFKAYQRQNVKSLFDELLNELLSINPKHIDIIDISNILNARKNVLDNLDKDI
jgi:hypothetical protein